MPATAVPAPDLSELAKEVPQRPAGFCTGCPERPLFTAMKLVQREIGQHHVSADIGCHLFSILPPFHIGNTTMGYGLGTAGASAFKRSDGKRPIAVMGDGGFWHNAADQRHRQRGVQSRRQSHHRRRQFLFRRDGGQDLLSSKAYNRNRSTKHKIETAVRGIGVNWVRAVDDTYDLTRMRDAIKEALTTKETGPKVVIAQSECMLNKQRRTRPLFGKAVKAGKRVVRERFGVDASTCTGDHACIRLSGCPSLTIKPNPDPLKLDPVAHVDNSCVGCGLCGEVSHAEVLCPSFYKAQIVFNPTWRDRAANWLRARVIGFFQHA